MYYHFLNHPVQGLVSCKLIIAGNCLARLNLDSNVTVALLYGVALVHPQKTARTQCPSVWLRVKLIGVKLGLLVVRQYFSIFLFPKTGWPQHNLD